MELILSNILFILCIIIFFFWSWILIRNNKVFEFRKKVNRLCEEYTIRQMSMICNGWELFYDTMPDYNKMLFSFKKLRLESYFTPEEIDKLLNK